VAWAQCARHIVVLGAGYLLGVLIMQSYDVVLIGAGHNALVCAAYLLKAGHNVLLLEKNAVPGGGATTEERLSHTAPGFKFNPCAIDHIFIHLGPVVDELELTQYGLEYQFYDPTVFCPHPDGKCFLAHRSVEKTCAEIARYSPRDAEKYAEFIQFWQRVMGVLIPMFNAPPTSLIDISGNFDLTKLQDLFSVVGTGTHTIDFMRTLFSSPRDLINEYFDSEFLKAPLARMSAELSFPPSQKTGTVGSLMMAMRHQPGAARPRGGTGALTEALVNRVQSLGGEILTHQMVEKVLVEDGQATAVQTADGQVYHANRGVISSIDAKRLFLNLMDAGEVDTADPNLRERLKRRIVSNNESILKIDCALAEPPRFEHHNHQDAYLTGAILIADSVDHVELAHIDPQLGRIPEDPSMFAVVPTIVDPSQAPEGKHTLWIEFFAPYQIKGAEGTGLKGTGWTDELKNQIADRVLDKLATYTPNLKSSILARYVESPAELGERLGVLEGNYYHLDMTFDQMMFFRPLPEIANYKTPIRNLFLTGAGTHPGGSISGLPGRNCARVFLHAQHPIAQTLTDARDTLKAAAQSVLNPQT
jgi:beta-carotene ketolase (CrtO type)